MAHLWVDDGTQPPYTWEAIVGMILLDHKKAGNHDGLSYFEIAEQVLERFTFYVGKQTRGGWRDSMRRSLKAGVDSFIKRGKDIGDRDMTHKKRNDKWIVRDGKEDNSVNPKRNLTKRAVETGGSGSTGAAAKRKREEEAARELQAEQDGSPRRAQSSKGPKNPKISD